MGESASIVTWASLAAAAGSQLAAFLEDVPGATRPRDYEHLKRQQLVMQFAAAGGWTASIEQPIDKAWERSRSIDIQLDRVCCRETAVVEVWDLFDDVGAAYRGLDAKVASVTRQRAAQELMGAEPWRVCGLIVVRSTRRNRDLVREFAPIFRARFPAPARSWLAALRESNRPMPLEAGFLWSDVRGTRLFAARL